MAQPANTFDRYDVNNSVRDDLIDKIFTTSPEETPVTSGLGKTTASNTYHEWQRDALAAANKDNALIDGDDFAGTALTGTERIGNYCQIFSKQPIVSRRADIVNKAGQKTAMAYQTAKMMKEMKRDMEAAVLSSNVAVAGNSTTASKLAGFGAMIYTNISSGAGGSTPAHTSGAATVAPTAGTARAFTEALLKTVVQLAFTNSGMIPRQVVMSPNHKTLFSAFTGIAVNRYQVGKKEQGRIVGGADVYMSDFGEMEIVPHYLQVGASDVFGFNPDYGTVVYLDGFQSTPLAKTGDSDKEQVLVDCLLRLDAENCHFKIANLTP